MTLPGKPIKVLLNRWMSPVSGTVIHHGPNSYDPKPPQIGKDRNYSIFADLFIFQIDQQTIIDKLSLPIYNASMFFGRKYELSTIKGAIASNRAELGIVYGFIPHAYKIS